MKDVRCESHLDKGNTANRTLELALVFSAIRTRGTQVRVGVKVSFKAKAQVRIALGSSWCEPHLGSNESFECESNLWS